MSESDFLKRQGEEFLAEHPREDGWKVYEFSATLQDSVSLRYLLDFLRDRYPAAVKRRQSVNEVRTPDMRGDAGDSHLIEPRAEWDIGKELDIYDWFGRVDIEWQGEPLHYLRVRVRSSNGRLSLRMMAAAKSNAALRSILREVKGYAKEREKNDAARIRVINDEDIPFPSGGWDDVILPSGMAADIRDNVKAFFSEAGRNRYAELGLPYRRGFIFSGPPGCGKTLTLKALANTAEVPVVVLQVRALVDEHDLWQAFRSAQDKAPALLIFEDLDRLVSSREVGVSYFLNLLDGLKVTEGVLVIATSNYPQKLDPALSLRPSRFDRIWRFPLPEEGQRRMLLEKKGGCFFSSRTLDHVAKESRGFSMAFVQEIVVNALLSQAHLSVQPKDEDLLRSLAALHKQKKEATKEDEQMLDRESIGFNAAQQLTMVGQEFEE